MNHLLEQLLREVLVSNTTAVEQGTVIPGIPTVEDLVSNATAVEQGTVIPGIPTVEDLVSNASAVEQGTETPVTSTAQYLDVLNLRLTDLAGRRRAWDELDFTSHSEGSGTQTPQEPENSVSTLTTHPEEIGSNLTSEGSTLGNTTSVNKRLSGGDNTARESNTNAINESQSNTLVNRAIENINNRNKLYPTEKIVRDPALLRPMSSPSSVDIQQFSFRYPLWAVRPTYRGVLLFKHFLLSKEGEKINNNILSKFERYRKSINPNINANSGLDSKKASMIESINAFEAVSNSVVVEADKGKMFGPAGDITLNEVASNVVSYLTPAAKFIQENPNILEVLKITGGLITPYLMYRGIVRLFNKSIDFSGERGNLQGEDLASLIRTQNRVKRVFMLIGAPLIVGSLIAMNKAAFSTVHLDVNINSSLSDSSSTSGLNSNTGQRSMDTKILKLSSLFLTINNKFPNWKRILFIIYFTFLVFKYIFIDKGTSSPLGKWVLFNSLYIRWFLIISVILALLVIIYYALNLWLYIAYSQNKIKIPTNKYIPKFILTELQMIETLSKIEDKSIMTNLYFKTILLYFLILCILVILLFIYI